MFLFYPLTIQSVIILTIVIVIVIAHTPAHTSLTLNAGNRPPVSPLPVRREKKRNRTEPNGCTHVRYLPQSHTPTIPPHRAFSTSGGYIPTCLVFHLSLSQ